MLDFEIDVTDIDHVAKELGATPKQVRLSYNRALTRTAATLRKLSSKGLQSELGLRRATAIRRRLKTLRVKGQGKGMGEVRLWYGLNDLAISEFKGSVSETAGGASYAGTAGSHRFPDAFVARSASAKRRTILRRKGEARLPIVEQRLPIKDKADTYVEDEIFHRLEEIFWGHFRRDLEARVKYLRAT